MKTTVSNQSDWRKLPKKILSQIECQSLFLNDLHKNQKLVTILYDTYEYFKGFENEYNIHAMRYGTVLGGLLFQNSEIYFTFDLLEPNQQRRGLNRTLWKCKIRKGQIKNIQFIGVANTHGKENVFVWSDFKEENYDAFFKIKGPKLSRDNFIAVRKTF